MPRDVSRWPSQHCTGRGGRGCDCSYHIGRRIRAAQYARQRRERELAERQRTSTVCPRRAGSGRCGAVLETLVERGGQTRIVCPLCERRKRGICRDCPKPVEGRVGTAMRCAEHKAIARATQIAAHQARNRDEINVRARSRLRALKRAGDARYLEKLEYKRAYRKTHRDKVRAQKQRSYARRKEQLLGDGGYFPEYRRKHAAHYRDIQQQKTRARQALWTPPICIVEGCGAVIEHDWVTRERAMTRYRPARCDVHCFAYELRLRRTKREILVEEARAEMLAGVPSKNRVAHRPPGYFETRAAGGLRRCLTPGCDRVVTGRKKKCTRCKADEARRAAEILAAHQGRGRRTDLLIRSQGQVAYA